MRCVQCVWYVAVAVSVACVVCMCPCVWRGSTRVSCCVVRMVVCVLRKGLLWRFDISNLVHGYPSLPLYSQLLLVLLAVFNVFPLGWMFGCGWSRCSQYACASAWLKSDSKFAGWKLSNVWQECLLYALFSCLLVFVFVFSRFWTLDRLSSTSARVTTTSSICCEEGNTPQWWSVINRPARSSDVFSLVVGW